MMTGLQPAPVAGDDNEQNFYGSSLPSACNNRSAYAVENADSAVTHAKD
jgi:hypothetical protein